MKFRTFTALVAFAFSSINYAQEATIKSDSFIGSYVTICMQNLNNLEALRSRLIQDKIPKFPPEQGKNFLMGMEGDAWPRPQDGVLGNLVLALPTGKNVCAIYARRANQNEVEQQFIKLVEKTPVPFLVAERKSDVYNDTPANGKTRTITFTWGASNADRKLRFVLTTSALETAELQALATASIGPD